MRGPGGQGLTRSYEAPACSIYPGARGARQNAREYSPCAEPAHGGSTWTETSVPPLLRAYPRLPNVAGAWEKPLPRSKPSMGRPSRTDSKKAPYFEVPTIRAPAIAAGAVTPPSGIGTRQSVRPVAGSMAQRPVAPLDASRISSAGTGGPPGANSGLPGCG